MKKLFFTLTFCFTFVPSLIQLPKVNSEEYRCKFTHDAGGEELKYNFTQDYIRRDSEFLKRDDTGQIMHYGYDINFENDRYLILLTDYYNSIGAILVVFIDKLNNEVYESFPQMKNDKKRQPHGLFGTCYVIY